MKTKTALLTVHQDCKTLKLVDFAADLAARGFKIYGSKGTAGYLNDNAVSATDLADLVGNPILGHRVVTLSREVHAGLLSRKYGDIKSCTEDEAELARLHIEAFDVVCVEPYPFSKVLAAAP